MTEQRKRTLPIRETLSLLDSMIRGGENHSELSKRKLEESRSILDKLEDPWFYVEDGELPELDVSKEDYVKETGESVKISKSKELLLMDYDGETSKGFFVTYESLNGYKASCFEIENTGIEVETDQVKCFIPIPQPQK